MAATALHTTYSTFHNNNTPLWIAQGGGFHVSDASPGGVRTLGPDAAPAHGVDATPGDSQPRRVDVGDGM